MKSAFIIFCFSIVIFFITACSNGAQNDAVKQAEQVQAAIKENMPGTMPTTKDGWSVRAKINGKDWVATSIMPPDAAGRIIGYYDKEWIGLPYDRRYLIVGKKISFGESNAADLATNDDIGLWGGRKGEMEITKVDDNWAEGKFYFTGSTSRSDKTMEVTDGFFRISLAQTR